MRNLIDSSSPLRLTNFPFWSVSFVSIDEIVLSVTGRYTKLVGTSIILKPGPTLGKNEYNTFLVVPLVYEAPIISLVTLKVLTFIMFTISSDSLYPSKYIQRRKPRTDLIELTDVRSTL